MKRPGLGRGLDVLLPQTEEILQTVVRDITIDEIDHKTDQPRKEFDKEALEQLSQSIQEAGVLSPILVVENNGRYRIVAGERRYRASRLAGLSTIPCIVRNLTTVQQMEAALIENLQREDLNPIEEAVAIRSLMSARRSITKNVRVLRSLQRRQVCLKNFLRKSDNKSTRTATCDKAGRRTMFALTCK